MSYQPDSHDEDWRLLQAFPAGIRLDDIFEDTVGHGVEIDGCLIKDGSAANALTAGDADTLDGLQATGFLVTGVALETSDLDNQVRGGVFGWTNAASNAPVASSYGQGVNIVSTGASHNGSNNWITQLAFTTGQNTAYFRSKTNAGSWSAWREIWHDASDGAGSGLDADTLDGLHASEIAPTFNNVTGTSATMVGSQGYVANNAGLVTLTLPSNPGFGKRVTVVGAGAGGWRISQNSGDTIRFSEDYITTTGTGGYVLSTDDHDSVVLLCVSSAGGGSAWRVESQRGSLDVN